MIPFRFLCKTCFSADGGATATSETALSAKYIIFQYFKITRTIPFLFFCFSTGRDELEEELLLTELVAAIFVTQ